jgi:hypothetical protein
MQPTRKGDLNMNKSPLIGPEDVPGDEEAFVEWLTSFLTKDKFGNLPEVYGYCMICCRPLLEYDFWFWKVILEGDRDYEGYCVRCLFTIAEARL